MSHLDNVRRPDSRGGDVLCVGPIAFIYFSRDESIAINGVHFTKNVPAKILRKVLAAYLREGRTRFEFREFKRDAEIAPNPKNSGFEVRLRRLEEGMRTIVPEVGIRLDGKGTFSFVPSTEIDFREE